MTLQKDGKLPSQEGSFREVDENTILPNDDIWKTRTYSPTPTWVQFDVDKLELLDKDGLKITYGDDLMKPMPDKIIFDLKGFVYEYHLQKEKKE